MAEVRTDHPSRSSPPNASFGRVPRRLSSQPPGQTPRLAARGLCELIASQTHTVRSCSLSVTLPLLAVRLRIPELLVSPPQDAPELHLAYGMLERATASFQARACESLWHVRDATVSRRSLSLNFWDHAAPVPETSKQTSPSTSAANQKIRARHVRQVAGVTRPKPNDRLLTAAHSSPFLDFLYPPHALALLNTVAAKRALSTHLPGSWRVSRSGRVRSTRSPTRHSNLHVSARHAKRRAFDQDATKDLEELANDDTVQEAPVEDEEEQEEQQAEESSPIPMHLRERSFEPLHSPAQALAALRRKIERRAQPTDKASDLQFWAEDVWRLYEFLGEDERSNIRLHEELLLWFSRIKRATAQAHCITLYETLASDKRSLLTYQAAASAYCFLKRDDAAAQAQKEGLKNLENGAQISKMLFRKAVRSRNWPLALAVLINHNEACDAKGSSTQKALFWVWAAEMPHIINQATTLITYISKLDARDKRPYNILATNLAKEALKQHLVFIGDDNNAGRFPIWPKVTQSRILFDQIRLFDDQWSDFFSTMLYQMLTEGKTKPRYALLHPLVTYAYRWFLTAKGAKPPESLLGLLLGRLTQYLGAKGNLGNKRNHFTVQSLAMQWHAIHGIVSAKALHVFLAYFARAGAEDMVEKWFLYLLEKHPYHDQKESFHRLIYVYARRADLPKAKEAFQRVADLARENSDTLDIQCWNILMHAHGRADDLAGATLILDHLVKDGRLMPDAHTFHPLLDMLANRGEVEKVQQLLTQFDTTTKAVKTTAMLGSLMTAHVKNDDIPEAERTLRFMIEELRLGRVEGSLTGGFNVLLTAWALDRDMPSVRRVHEWMKSESVPRDAKTFATLMQALTLFKLTNAAHSLMTKTMMKKENLRPTGFHYAIIITGYIHQKQYTAAMAAHEQMQKLGVPPSPASLRAYLSAKALYEQSKINPRHQEGHRAPLTGVLKELSEVVRLSDGSEAAAKEPAFGREGTDRGVILPEYFDRIIKIHGDRECLEAVRVLFAEYQETVAAAGHETDPVPMAILTALMNANVKATQYALVEECWELAKSQADQLAAALPEIRPGDVKDENEGNFSEATLDTLAPHVGVEAGFKDNDDIEQDLELHYELPVEPDLPKPVAGRRHILSQPLQYYLQALAAQKRITDCIRVVASLITQGYTLDNKCFNSFIIHLCEASPPLVQLAFTLSEKFMAARFPGWKEDTRYVQVKAKEEKLEHIQAGYLPPSLLIPQYATLVHLASAFLWLKRRENQGKQVRGSELVFERGVGSTKGIEEKAPMTLFAVQSMPYVDDMKQKRLLRADQ